MIDPRDIDKAQSHGTDAPVGHPFGCPSGCCYDHKSLAEPTIGAYQRRIARLECAIKNAPHQSPCHAAAHTVEARGPCSCWKSKVDL